MHRRSSIFAIAIAIAGAWACGSSKPPPPVIETQAADIGPAEPPPEPKSEPVASTEGVEPVGKPVGKPESTTSTPATNQPEITVLDAGKDPKKEIRHKFKKNARQKLLMQSTTRISGANLPLPSFTLDAPIEAKITEVNSAGEAKFAYTAGPFKTKTSGGGALGSLLGGMGGGGGPPEKIVGWGWITAQGVVKEQHVTEGMKDGDAPIETGDPFPADPIGVGARWEVVTVLVEKGTKYRQTSTYDLLKMDARSVQTKVSRRQEPLAGSGDPVAESSGELAYKLGQIYPTGRLSMSRDVQVAIPGADELGLKMDSEVTIKAR
jgi:hypothetical protein